MNILIAGGLGFIGHVVAQECLNNGHDVIIIDNHTTYSEYEPTLHAKKILRRTNTIIHRDKDVSIYDNDIGAKHTMIAYDEMFKSWKPDVIINLANVPIAGVVVEQPVMSANTMITGLLGLLELARKHNVKRFVNISSSMVYGDFLTDPASEDQLCDPLEIYGNLKLTGERLVRSYTRLHAIEHAIVRPSACYGPTGNEAFVITKFLRAAREGGTIHIQGSDTSLDFTYVNDLAKGIYLAATKEEAANETFNMTYGEKRSLIEVAEIVKEMYPDVTINITERDQLYPKRGQLSIEKAKYLLGYNPKVSIEDGLKLFDRHVTDYDL
jgi:UDP-glucose 4-epimerase